MVDREIIEPMGVPPFRNGWAVPRGIGTAPIPIPPGTYHPTKGQGSKDPDPFIGVPCHRFQKPVVKLLFKRFRSGGLHDLGAQRSKFVLDLVQIQTQFLAQTSC